MKQANVHGVNGAGRLEDLARHFVEAGGGTIPVTGRSMHPTFDDASTLLVARRDRVRFGDVLVYSNGSYLVAHRLVGIRSPHGHRTKGDGVPHLDLGRVAHDKVLGVVVAIERDGVRYRTDRWGGRVYARLIGAVSAAEGFLYRVATRIDRFTSAATRRSPSGPSVTFARRGVHAAGRGLLALLDLLLFRGFHASR